MSECKCDEVYKMFEAEKDRADQAEKREGRLKLGLQDVIGRCNRAEAYTDAAYAHYYAYSTLQDVYKDN